MVGVAKDLACDDNGRDKTRSVDQRPNHQKAPRDTGSPLFRATVDGSSIDRTVSILRRCMVGHR